MQKIFSTNRIRESSFEPPYYKTFLGRSRSSYSALFISDMHCGNFYSICSQKPYISAGNTCWTPEKFNEDMLWFWDSLNDRVAKRPTMLTINGEFIDGNNRNAQGMGLWSGDLNDQADDAIKLIKRLKYDNVTVTKGSPYHSKTESINIDEMIARRISAYSYSGIYSQYDKTGKKRNKKIQNTINTETNGKGNNITIKYYLYYRILDYVFNIVHKIGYSKNAQYRPTPVSREMMIAEFEKNKLFNDNEFNDDTTTLYIRSHTHNNLDVGFNHSRGIVTPCWKLFDDYLSMSGISATDIGALEIILDPNEYQLVYHLLPSKLRPKIKIPDFTPSPSSSRNKPTLKPKPIVIKNKNKIVI